MADHDPLCHAAPLEFHDPDCCDCALIAKVRADERERASARHAVQRERLRVVMRADLRAKVEALPDAHHYGTQQGGHVQRSDVLSLIDGADRG